MPGGVVEAHFACARGWLHRGASDVGFAGPIGLRAGVPAHCRTRAGEFAGSHERDHRCPRPLHSSGIMHVGGVTFGGWLVSMIKSIDVFVGMSRREVCAKP